MLSLPYTRRPSLIWLAALSVLLVLITACGGGSDAPPAEPTPVTYQSYTNEELGFSLEHPQSWIVAQTPDELIEFKSADDVTFDLNYTGGAIVQVMTLPTIAFPDGPLAGLELLKEDMIASVVESGEEATIVQEPTDVTINNIPAAVTKIEARQGTVDGKAEIYLVSGDELTALVMIFFPRDEETGYRAVFDQMLNTFELAASDVSTEPTEEPVVAVDPTSEPETESESETVNEAPPSADTLADGVTYTSDEFQLSLTHPAGWLLEDTEGYIAIAPDQASLDAPTFEGTGGIVIVGGEFGAIAPEDFLDLAVDPAEFIDDPVIIGSMESIAIQGAPAARMLYQGTLGGDPAEAMFIGITEGTNAALVVLIYDPVLADTLGLSLQSVADTIVLESGSASGDEGTTVSEETDLPLTADAYEVLALSADLVTFTSDLSLEEVAEFYRVYAEENELTEREITTLISEDVISLVFDGWSDTQSLVVQAIPFEGATTVTVTVQDM